MVPRFENYAPRENRASVSRRSQPDRLRCLPVPSSMQYELVVRNVLQMTLFFLVKKLPSKKFAGPIAPLQNIDFSTCNGFEINQP